MILVLDASAIITLARMGRLDLLQRLAEKVYIPEAVFREVAGGGHKRPGSEIVRAKWISRRQVRDHATVARLRTQLGGGEAEAIVLALEIRADALILDDATARRIAEAEGQKVVGLLGLLLIGKERGVVRALKPILDEMVAKGFYIDDVLYGSILRQAGEEAEPSS